MRRLLLLLAAAGTAFGQWSDFSTQTASTNLSAAMNAKPAVQIGSGAPTVACTAGRDSYFDAVGTNWYDCTATGNPGTWQQRVLSGGTWVNPAWISSLAWSKITSAPSFLLASNNLSDLTNAATARGNLGLGTAAAQNVAAFLQAANNLGDLGNVATARGNLGLGTAAIQNVAAFLQAANNLGDLGNVATARGNLGLGAFSLLANPATTAGDLFYWSGSALGRLAFPGNGTCYGLQWTSAAPGYVACPGATGGISSIGWTLPSVFSISPNPMTSNGSFALSFAGSQTSHQVLGTCGSATTFGPCPLVAGDIPALPYMAALPGTAPGGVVSGVPKLIGVCALGSLATAPTIDGQACAGTATPSGAALFTTYSLTLGASLTCAGVQNITAAFDLLITQNASSVYTFTCSSIAFPPQAPQAVGATEAYHVSFDGSTARYSGGGISQNFGQSGASSTLPNCPGAGPGQSGAPSGADYFTGIDPTSKTLVLEEGTRCASAGGVNHVGGTAAMPISIAPVSHMFVTDMTAGGVLDLGRPAFSDISGTAAEAQLPNGNAIATVQANGTPATQAATLNLVNGSNVTITCSTTSGTTSCTVNASGGSSPTFPANPQTSTYSVVSGDFAACKMINITSGTFTVTLPGAAPANGQCLWVSNFGSGVITIARNGLTINGAAANLTLAAGSSSSPTGVFLDSDGSNYWAQTFGAGTGGGVTTWTGDSVIFSNSASAGAVTATLVSQVANCILAGPASGANATPTCRALVQADLPAGTMFTFTPALGSSDTLSCSASGPTAGITSGIVYFATTFTLPAFTQTGGATFDVRYTLVGNVTTSGPSVAASVELSDLSTVVFSTANPGAQGITALTTGVIPALFEFSIPASGASTTLDVGSLGAVIWNRQDTGGVNHTAQLTGFNSTATHTGKLGIECSTTTGTNTYTLEKIVVNKVY